MGSIKAGDGTNHLRFTLAAHKIGAGWFTTFTSREIKMSGNAKRTTHRSSKGKKLYAVRDAEGEFKDIQTFERAHRADLAKKSKSEKAATKKQWD